MNFVQLSIQVKDYSKTGKDEHLGSFAARINDMQEGKNYIFQLQLENNFFFQATEGFFSVITPEEN